MTAAACNLEADVADVALLPATYSAPYIHLSVWEDVWVSMTKQYVVFGVCSPAVSTPRLKRACLGAQTNNSAMFAEVLPSLCVSVSRLTCVDAD